ncbi:MAG: hypothetical protein AB7U78_18980, partial [Hyphomicrobiaceae bacterium]
MPDLQGVFRALTLRAYNWSRVKPSNDGASLHQRLHLFILMSFPANSDCTSALKLRPKEALET